MKSCMELFPDKQYLRCSAYKEGKGEEGEGIAKGAAKEAT